MKYEPSGSMFMNETTNSNESLKASNDVMRSCLKSNHKVRIRQTKKILLLPRCCFCLVVAEMFLCFLIPCVDAFLTFKGRISYRIIFVEDHPTTVLKVATNPIHKSTAGFQDDDNKYRRKQRQQQQQQPWRKPYRSKHSGRRKQQRNKNAKDPEQVEAAVSLALESLRSMYLSSSRHDNDDDDDDDKADSSTVTALLFPSVRECNAALSAFGDAGDLLRALRLFGKMRKAAQLQAALERSSSSSTTSTTMASGISWPVPTPTLVTYSTLMSRAVRARKPHVALRLWDMRPVCLEPDVKAINILMNCHAKLGNVAAAMQVLNEMSVEPNTVTFNTVLNACQKAGDLDAALEIKSLMDSVFVNIVPDARTYTTLMATVARRKSAASGQKDPTLATALLQEMYQRGVSPNGMTYSAFIEACGRCGRIDLALQGLRLMQRQKEQEKGKLLGNDIDQYVLLDNEVGAWTSAIHVCGKTGRWETAVRLFGSMQKLGCMPNTVTCGCLTDSLLRAGRTAETLQVLRYMKKAGIVPSEVMYTSLMTLADRLVQTENQCSRVDTEQVVAEESNTKAIEVYTELMMSLMEAAGKQPTARNTISSSSSSSSSASSATRAADHDSNTLLLKVFLVFQQMKTAGAEPDLACYNVLLRACARAGDVARAQDVMRQIQACPYLQPSDRSWSELLRAAAMARQADTAESIWNQGISFHQQRRRFVDEPERRWIPSTKSLQWLLIAYLREAAVVTDNVKRQCELYERVVQTYEDILMGERRMGLQRIDPMEILDDRRVILSIIHSLVALRPLVHDSARLVELHDTGRSLLKLECLREEPPLSWSAEKAVDALHAWDLAP